MSIAKLYAWTDTNATPNTYYTDNTTIAVNMPLYNNQGVDTGAKINYIESDGSFNVDFTLTVNTTPSDATVTFNTGTVSGKTCTVKNGTTVTYTVSKTGYATSQTYTKIVTQNETITAPALVQEAFKITYPDDARLALTNINGNIYQNNNMVKLSITTPHSFKMLMTDINRYITGYWEESNVQSAWFEKNTTLYLSSTYTTGSSFKKKTYFYDRTITLTEDTSFTVTNDDYWRI